MDADTDDRLSPLPVERALTGPPRYTLAELAERAGLGREELSARLRAMGLNVPDDEAAVAFGDEDVAMARRVRRYGELGLEADETRAAAHLLSGSMSRVAEALGRVFAEAYGEAGAAAEDPGGRHGEMARELLPLVVEDLDYLLRHHLRELVRNDALGMQERATGRLADAVDVAVAFADIVGFTRLGQEVPEAELSGIAERLDALAAGAMRRPARVVKTIGDAVMLVSPDPGALVESVLDLMGAAAAAEGMPPLRAGIAYGRALPRLGDWYGGTVNLAARLCSRARPESVLTTNELRDVLGEAAAGYHWSEAGFKRLKGFDDPLPTLRLRREPPSGTPAA